jgi:hypothetical protein
MNLAENESAHSAGPPPAGAGSPVWYVTNGAAVVGPVDTDLLLRGITSSRIPNDCMVIQENWNAWRSIDQIRELGRIVRPFSWASDDGLGAGVPEEMVSRARDAGEALFFAMHAAVRATRATAGLVHRAREPFVGLVTSSARGAGVDDQLGQVIPRRDPMLELALQGAAWLGPVGASSQQRALARRFSACPGELAGLAMVPVFDGGRLLAMIELARAGHPFRSGDAAVLRQIADVVCRH